MMNYKPVTEEVLEALRKAVGAEYVMTDPTGHRRSTGGSAQSSRR